MIPSPFGSICAVAEACEGPQGVEAYLTAVKLGIPQSGFAGQSGSRQERSECHCVLDQTQMQLGEYFDRHRTAFELPTMLRGTDFQKSVWNCLDRIRYGETWSYSQLAAAIGSPRASRAVGAALGKNPLWIVVPCHRVIGKTGRLVGFAGGLDCKRGLLELEKRMQIG